MEQKLAEFRARRAKVTPETNTRGHCETRSSEDKVGRVQAHAQAAFRKLQGLYERWKPKWRLRTPEAQPDNTTIQAPHEGTSSRASDTPEYYTEPSSYSLWTVTLLLKFLLWLVLLGLFVELEFGLAYFVLSMFYWLYEGTRGPGARRKGEKSAYSVFNPGCEAIEGTLTAEQFERELQYRPMAGL